MLPCGLSTLFTCGAAEIPVSRILILLCAVHPGIILVIPRLLVPKWV